MPPLKIAFVGAGSFVFGPSMLSQTFLEHGLDGVELALVDPDQDVLDLMAAVGRRMIAERGLRGSAVSTHTDRREALRGAQFILCSAAPGMHRCYGSICDILDRHIPGHDLTEFGGIYGIDYSLRQIHFITTLAQETRELCPDAWLLNAANPLPRVCQAAHEAGLRTVGFCSASLGVYDLLWRLFEGQPLRFPFEPARQRFRVTLAGLNHFVWMLALEDRTTGRDLMPELRNRLSGIPDIPQYCRSITLAHETGFPLLPNDEHTRDFLKPWGAAPPRHGTSHGSADERQRLRQRLRAYADGELSWADAKTVQAWERPLDLIAALTRGKPAEFHSLNLANDGQIANLPQGLFVETPATADASGIKPLHATLPETVLPYCERTALVTRTLVRAGRQRKRSLVHQAVELDPTITDRPAGIAAIEECLAKHADLLPVFN